MKTRKIFLFALLIITLVGCNDDNSRVSNDLHLNEPNPDSTSESYTSIREFQELFGQNLKNDFLEIKTSKYTLTLSMDISIETKLLKKLQNTANNFSFNFADITGNTEISNSLLHQQKYVSGNLLVKQLNKKNNHVKIIQYLPLQKNLDIERLDYLKKPENYEFQILDENDDPVFILAGLDLRTMDNP
ncbi:hypothetical protein [Bacillus safensis]|uniref:hypothetical protein n=1 Tax=Bacillus safensis TaxID=561879 RepID=UPI000F0681CF|nr:hypothetical protein [Bacillus safensis]MED4592677.1 hypothetical protein [Bacillus safensis]MED4638508.1 hypothetical protein [Bacillus safensis]WBL30096.1 hypothetical protein ORQ91_02671 [Bacillus safensis]VCT96197.1 hypothetical protein AIDNDMCJ_03715 [Bacillus safensis]